MKSLADIIPSIVVETCAGHAAPKLGSASGPRSHTTGIMSPIGMAVEAPRAQASPTSVPAHAVRARVWTGGGGSASDDAGPVMGAVFLGMPPARRKRGFSHFIYKKGGQRVPIYR